MTPSSGLYRWNIHFARGSIETLQRDLRFPLIYALGFPEHRIVITSREDRADSCETGAAMRRIEVVRQYFLAHSIAEERLELRTHAEDCCIVDANYSELSRCSTIDVIPRVTSLYPGVGGPLLSAREIYGMKSAWAAAGDALRGNDATYQELEGGYSTLEWKRILGHETLREWLEVEGYHP